MKHVFFLELRRFWPHFVFFNLALGLGREIAGLNFIFLVTFVLPFLLTIAVNPSLQRSFWYLNLPGSRRQLLGSVILQNAVISMILGLNMLVWIYVFDTAEFAFFPTIRLIACVLGFGLFISMVNLFYQRRFRAQALPSPKIVLAPTFGGVILLIFVLRKFGDQPLLLWTLALGMLWIFTFLFARAEVLVRKDSEILVKGTKYFVVLAFFVPLITAVILVHRGDLNQVRTQRALAFLGRIPAFVSDERLLEMYTNPTVEYPADVGRRLDYFRRSWDQNLWLTRTEACQNSPCLDVSADVVELGRLNSDQLIIDFEALTKHCEFGFGKRGEVDCTAISVSRAHLAPWLTRLREVGVLDRWLTDSVPHKIYALRGLKKSASTKLLKNDPNPLVARAAREEN